MWPFKKKPPKIHYVEAIDGKATFLDKFGTKLATLTWKSRYYWGGGYFNKPMGYNGIAKLKEYLQNHRTILLTDDKNIMLPLHMVDVIELQEIPVTLEIEED